MLNNLVTYHIHRLNPLPPYDALAYQYLIARNGVYVRAETKFFSALLPIAIATVRGLAPLQPEFRRISAADGGAHRANPGKTAPA
jgi:hypothetical protein